MSNRIQVADLTYFPALWPHVEKYLSESLTAGQHVINDVPTWNECYNIHHVQSFISSGAWLLVVAVNEQNQVQGAATVSFINYPMSRVAVITLTGGRLVTGEEEFKQLVEILKYHGATKIQAYCRDSVVKLLKRRGFEPKATLVEAAI